MQLTQKKVPMASRGHGWPWRGRGSGLTEEHCLPSSLASMSPRFVPGAGDRHGLSIWGWASTAPQIANAKVSRYLSLERDGLG